MSRNTNRNDKAVKSPFFAPGPPVKSHIFTSPGGTVQSISKVDDEAPKSSVPGAAFNLINAIIGAGIVGVPFAVQQCSLVLGLFMVLFFALLTLKTVRLLIETAKHVDVSTYERLAEASLGKQGFIGISTAMFIMSYGAMVGYMMIVKNNLSFLLGVSDEDVGMQRAVLTIASLAIMLPLSLNRDMSALARTSSLSVVFDVILVGIVAYYSPISESVQDSGGLMQVVQDSQPNIRTFFIGIGVLCFAFVCQHSAFIIASSLEKPTRTRWNSVTLIAMTVCACLAATMGVAGYLGFQKQTNGDILINLGEAASVKNDSNLQTASNLARALLCTTMFFVYPMELFVARHVCVVIFFKGRRAHEGDDHSVLARKDRRVAITLAMYLLSLLPSLLFTDLGSVFAITGSLGGAILSYIGPGITYMAVHGEEFLTMASSRWPNVHNAPRLDSKKLKEEYSLYDEICWYLYLMPLWCKIANHGQKMIKEHREAEALKSPFPMPLGRVAHMHSMKMRRHDLIKPNAPLFDEESENLPPEEQKPLLRTNSFNSLPTAKKSTLDSKFQHMTMGQNGVLINGGVYGSTSKENLKSIILSGAADDISSSSNLLEPKRISHPSNGMNKMGASLLTPQSMSHVMKLKKLELPEEIDPQDESPSVWNFVWAAFYILFGFVAASAGLCSSFL